MPNGAARSACQSISTDSRQVADRPIEPLRVAVCLVVQVMPHGVVVTALAGALTHAGFGQKSSPTASRSSTPRIDS